MSTRTGAAGLPRAQRLAAAASNGNGHSIVDFDPSSLTLGEMEEVEKIHGANVAREMREGMSVSLLKLMITVYMRRANPGYTAEDASKIKFADINVTIANPTQAVSEPR